MPHEDQAEMHCGMCEHDWSARASDVCPACGSDEIETLAEARTHNEYVILRESVYADGIARGFTHDESAELAEYLARWGAAKIKAA